MSSLVLLAVVTASTLTDASDPPVQAVDDEWRDLMITSRDDVPTAIARALAIAGGWPVAYVVVIATLAVLAMQRKWRVVAFVSLSATVTFAINPLLKLAVERERPPNQLVEIGGYAFPSGHAAFGAVFCAALLLALAPTSRRWMAVALVLVLAMMWSRTYLSVHWLSDTVAGALLGIGVTLVLYWAMAPAARGVR